MQIGNQYLRRGFRLLIEPVTDLSLAQGRNAVLNHRRDVHRGGCNDDTAGLHSSGLCVIAEGLGKLLQ